jgi:hypothetical protein
MPKLKTFLFLGVAGGVVAAVRKRASGEQVQQVVDKAKQAAPAPVQHAVDSAVEKVTEAASSVTGGDDGGESGDRDATRRYAAPAEAGAQPPAEGGGAPSDEPQPTQAHSVTEAPEDPSLDATRAHDLPADVKMPDVSDDDPSVQEAEAAAAADARRIGTNQDENQP